MVNSTPVIAGLFSLLVSIQAMALNVTATVDKNPAIVDESVVLTVIADGSVAADAFDPSVLEQDFVVGGTSISSQTSMVNFKTTRTTQWTTLIIPRKTGVLTIPALTVDDATTKPIQLQVLAQGDKTAQQQKDIYLTADVSKHEVYVQQQFTLTVRLHLAAELIRGSLAEPKMTGAEIKQIGENNEYSQIIDGKRFRIIERVYAVKPQTSGKFVLHSTMFDGEISASKQQRRSVFSSFDRGKPVRMKGQEIDIQVNAAPADFTGEWLPSELIVIEENWPDEQSEYELGEPITRTVKITAAALGAEQLPKLEFNAPDGLKIYPDQADVKNGVQKGALISQKTQDFAIVPTKPGTFVLPEVTLPWFNTQLNRTELAVLPAKTIVVKGAVPVNIDNTTAMNTPLPVHVVEQSNTTLQWLFLAGWLLTAMAWLYQTKLKGRSFKRETFVPSTKHAYLKLLAACKQNNGQQVMALLPAWGNELFPEQNFSNLQQLSQHLQNDDFDKQLSHLQHCYYGAQQQAWHSDKLLKIISRLQTQGEQQQQVAFAINP
ncbi:protein BatD [Thalassotalea sp. HSM 43]|uniref:BatD family protein n=1 Tax=Thalassotalea sp. HSM 43 TaxID=2552945 RepID=UPI001080797A|nr:BatD family protein [Thalassotalea sp. HSM 43]QBY03341.1 protein BatD [Thalassotalea sp. HSM 43]